MTDAARADHGPDPRPRGIRNNNPGNIDWHPNSDPWRGLDDPPSDGRFCRFITPQYGIRAMAMTLRTYQTRHGCRSVRDIIDRWAPPNENDTGAYVEHVAEMVEVQPADPIDVADRRVMVPLIAAIIRHENGQQPYSPQVLSEGVAMA